MRKLYRVSWYYRYEGTGDIVGGTEERIAWGSLSLDLTPTPPYLLSAWAAVACMIALLLVMLRSQRARKMYTRAKYENRKQNNTVGKMKILVNTPEYIFLLISDTRPNRPFETEQRRGQQLLAPPHLISPGQWRLAPDRFRPCGSDRNVADPSMCECTRH